MQASLMVDEGFCVMVKMEIEVAMLDKDKEVEIARGKIEMAQCMVWPKYGSK